MQFDLEPKKSRGWLVNAILVANVSTMAGSFALLMLIAWQSSKLEDLILPTNVFLLIVSVESIIFVVCVGGCFLKMINVQSDINSAIILSIPYLYIVTLFALLTSLWIIKLVTILQSAVFMAGCRLTVIRNGTFDPFTNIDDSIVQVFEGYIDRLPNNQWIEIQELYGCCGYRSNNITLDPTAVNCDLPQFIDREPCYRELHEQARDQSRLFVSVIIIVAFVHIVVVVLLHELIRTNKKKKFKEP